MVLLNGTPTPRPARCASASVSAAVHQRPHVPAEHADAAAATRRRCSSGASWPRTAWTCRPTRRRRPRPKFRWATARPTTSSSCRSPPGDLRLEVRMGSADLLESMHYSPCVKHPRFGHLIDQSDGLTPRAVAADGPGGVTRAPLPSTAGARRRRHCVIPMRRHWSAGLRTNGLLCLRGRHSNPRPLGYEPNALPRLSTPRQVACAVERHSQCPTRNYTCLRPAARNLARDQ